MQPGAAVSHYELEMAKYAEEHGFTEFWNSDTGLARDVIVMMSAYLTYTKKLRIGLKTCSACSPW